MKNATVNIEDVRQFLYREARLLDEKKWEEWLACYGCLVGMTMAS